MSQVSLPNNSKKDGSIILIIKGFLIGIANIIPGVSGGTFALVLGIYDRLLASLNAINGAAVMACLRVLVGPHKPEVRKQFVQEMRRVDVLFLLLIAAGAGISVVACSFAINWLLVEYPSYTLAYFIGLIIPSIAVPWRMMEKRTPLGLLWMLPGMALTVGIALAFSSDTRGSDSLLAVFMSGVIAICAMVLPGISGSFVLLVVGQYQTAVGHVQTLVTGLKSLKFETTSFVYLAVLGLGCAIGIVAFARLLEWVLRRYRTATLAFLIGLVVGSFWIMWPFKDYDQGAQVVGRGGESKTDVQISTAPNKLPTSGKETAGCVAALVAGLVCAVGVERLGRSSSSSGAKKGEKDTDTADKTSAKGSNDSDANAKA